MRCLVVRLSSLGDVVLATAVLDPLRELFPSGRITWLTGPPYDSLLRNDPRIDEVVVWEGRFPWRLLRSGRFDVVIDLHRIPKTLLFSALVPARMRLGYPKARKLRIASVRGKSTSSVPHVVARYLGTLVPLGVRTDGEPRIFVSEEARTRAEGLLSDVPTPFVAVAPGAKWPTKRWRSEGFAEVIRRLMDGGYGVILVGDEGEEEFSEEVRRMAGRDVPSLVGTTDLPTLAGVLSLASALLGNDSGPVHLANAVGTPVVAIFGPTHPKLGFYPLKGRALTADLPCSPCSLHGEGPCRRGERMCMREVTPDDVLVTLEEFLPRRWT